MDSKNASSEAEDQGTANRPARQSAGAKVVDLTVQRYRPSDGRPDAAAIMAAIRERIKSDLENNRDIEPVFNPRPADFNASSRKAGEILNSEELRYLNQNHTFSLRSGAESISSHRPGLIGRIIVAVKRKALGILRHQLLKDYFVSEKDFNASLVRLLNDLTKYVDARDASNFWELIRKIDVDVTRALDRIERVRDEVSATVHASEKRTGEALNKMRLAFQDVNAEITELEPLFDVVSGLESLVAGLKDRPQAPAAAVAELEAAGRKFPDFSYLLLENRFRGSEEEISKRLSIYPPVFAGTHLPVLEIGGGRGELQLLFREAGLVSYNVDIDQAMVETARSRGLDARLGDGLAHLAALGDASLGGVIAIQVVEHLTQEQLKLLFGLCRAKVARGGKIVFETVNPRSLMSLSSNYFRDPTHVQPLHPDTLSFAMGLCGLKTREVRYLSPVPAGARLVEVPAAEHLSPRWMDTIVTINRNIRQLNELLYGCQDYCVIAEVE